MEKYGYLKKYINNNKAKAPRNSFSIITAQDIKNAENKLGFEFPNHLKEFWLEIGSGVLNKSLNGLEAFDYANFILPPKQIADIMLLKDDSEFVIPGLSEYFEEGYIKDDDIIFFEIGDMSSFLVMKPNSDKSNAVYDMIGRVIEEDFERFIWRLYHESPDYYLRVYPAPE